MNGTTASLVPEMLNCTDVDMTVLERQRARFKWQQHQQQVQFQEQEIIGYFNSLGELCGGGAGGAGGGGLLGEVVARSLKPGSGLAGNGWPECVDCFRGGISGACVYGSDSYINESTSFNYNNGKQNDNGLGVELNYAISRTSSCLPGAATGEAENMSSGAGATVGREGFKKRKADKGVAEEDSRDKRSKGRGEEGESKMTEKSSNQKGVTASNSNKSNSTNKKGRNNNNNNENSAEISKDNNSKVTEAQKPEYIHVRARRGQATDSHSLAERVRREKISERMKYLQDLVPGCNKVTGKAGMLDEIINYVQSLQRQVEFLSMKLAAINPRFDFNIDNLFAKEAFPACSTNFPTVGMSPAMRNSAYLQLNQLQQQIVACCGLEMGINPPDMGLRKTISAPVSIPQMFIDSACFNQIQPKATWDADLQNLYNLAFDQGKISFPSQPFTGPIDAGNLKTEM